ncbi:CHAT domain-containing protein [Bradyrhizobium sp. ma5]|uniref:CHAT domain-containing protein n=1 Tax=unclassified Bradyrhizobium TaxID=2631580 RepID=UPI0035DAA86E
MRDALVEITEWTGGGLAARLFRCRVDNQDFEYPDALTWQPLTLDPLPPLDTVANVEAYGTKIHSELANHPAINAELTQIFGAPANALLKFFISIPGERYRWETLCALAPRQFLAHQCAVSRLASMNDNASDARTFAGLIRMAAFLSPAGISAANEYASISAQVAAARAAGLEVECTIYLGDQELLEPPAAGWPAGIKVAPIPGDVQAMDRLLVEKPVEILHFFCHGFVTVGVQNLEFANINDTDIAAKSGSVVVSLERLNQILMLTKTTWLTVLNCCSGGKVVERLHSMARILTKRGSPVTIGMAEPISDTDASTFSAAFYEKLFAVMWAALGRATPNSLVLLDCASAVIEARRRVHNKYMVAPPDAFGRWTLPLLYERGAPLVVKLVQPIDPLMKQRVDTVAEALRTLPPTTPAEIRQNILMLLDAAPAVPLEFRPNAFGVIDAA